MGAGPIRSPLRWGRIRDLVTLRWPRALTFYMHHIGPRIGRSGARNIELSRWAARGVHVTRKAGTHGIRFEQDGIWVEDRGGCLWEYRPEVVGSALWAELGREHGQGQTEELASRLDSGSVVVDVGANVGSHGIRLSRMVDGLRVLAFEPSTAAFETLLRNIEKNGVTNLEAHRVAVSDHSGWLRLTTHLQAMNFVVPQGRGVTDSVTETVECRTLDELLEELTDRVDVVKIDVEGSELEVVHGARRTLERYKPTLLVEVESGHSERYGRSGVEVFQFLGSLGYLHRPMKHGEPQPSSGSVDRDLAIARNFLFET